MKAMIKLRDLKLGDVIRCFGGDEDFNTGIVKQVTDTEVTVYRPYGHADDVQYTGGVICYMGVEEYKIPRTGSYGENDYLVYSRKDLK